MYNGTNIYLKSCRVYCKCIKIFLPCVKWMFTFFRIFDSSFSVFLNKFCIEMEVHVWHPLTQMWTSIANVIRRNRIFEIISFIFISTYKFFPVVSINWKVGLTIFITKLRRFKMYRFQLNHLLFFSHLFCVLLSLNISTICKV